MEFNVWKINLHESAMRTVIGFEKRLNSKKVVRYAKAVRQESAHVEISSASIARNTVLFVESIQDEKAGRIALVERDFVKLRFVMEMIDVGLRRMLELALKNGCDELRTDTIFGTNKICVYFSVQMELFQ